MSRPCFTLLDESVSVPLTFIREPPICSCATAFLVCVSCARWFYFLNPGDINYGPKFYFLAFFVGWNWFDPSSVTERRWQPQRDVLYITVEDVFRQWCWVVIAETVNEILIPPLLDGTLTTTVTLLYCSAWSSDYYSCFSFYMYPFWTQTEGPNISYWDLSLFSQCFQEIFRIML
jgi:hypothetical protein